MKVARGRSIIQELAAKGISSGAPAGPPLTKRFPRLIRTCLLVDVFHGAGIAKKVAKLKPLGVIKG